ncbi:MAG: hypothetical protein M0026_21565 [Nocardiopsaceae bacterium]|nr:hypothetical protein [Nocardiopsaceae bacterium]
MRGELGERVRSRRWPVTGPEVAKDRLTDERRCSLTGSDGQPATRTDNTLKLRRLAD